jgi:hypothetical protein
MVGKKMKYRRARNRSHWNIYYTGRKYVFFANIVVTRLGVVTQLTQTITVHGKPYVI